MSSVEGVASAWCRVERVWRETVIKEGKGSVVDGPQERG